MMVTHKVVPANIYQVEKWLGVNENPDGDTGLQKGELSTATNVRVTNDGALQKRPGTQNVANLLSAYSVSVAATATTLLTETDITAVSFTVYPNVGVTDGGLVSPEGTPATMTYANNETYINDYYQDVIGNTYQYSECVKTDATVAEGESQGLILGGDQITTTMWTGISVVNGALAFSGTSAAVGLYNGDVHDVTTYKYFVNGGVYYKATDLVLEYNLPDFYTKAICVPLSISQHETYEWKFKAVTVAPSTGTAPVQGLWSGRVGTTEYMMAACDGRLWALSETDDVWTKVNICAVDTTNKVHMFGFDEKLYIMNGVAYMVWDAVKHTEHTYACVGSESGSYYITVDSVNYKFTLTTPTAGHLLIFSEYDLSLKLNGSTVSYTTGTVTTETNLTTSLTTAEVYNPAIAIVGYRPVTYTATPPAGGGTALERVNMLNGLRRVRFSPNGSATIFQLQETGLTSIDYVKNLTTNTYYTLTTDYTVSTTNGTVTFLAAPASGTSNIEIGYTYPTTYRTQIEAMTLSEFFNGANDNRVFIYGDGTNKTYYSGLDINGQATAEYFPDLNVAHIGEANTPITSMIRHYDRLIAFKEDSAYSIRYDILELVSGTTTASFYISTINKGIGCVGYGQAQMVVNHPRTLDGRSIYEWVATSSSGNITSDQRNATDVSKRVYNTIRELDLASAVTFYDKVNQEYYVVEDGIALVQNLYNGTWYVYRDFPALCMIVYKDELYYGTSGGYIRHVSRDYMHDVGADITVWAETGSMDFGAPHIRKNSREVFIVLKPETLASVNVTVQTDVQDDYTDTEVLEDYSGTVDAGIFDFANLHFGHFTFNVNDKPQTQKKKIKVKKFAWYKLIFHSSSNDTTFTLLNALIKYTNVSEVK